jgi:hypothetical protein
MAWLARGQGEFQTYRRGVLVLVYVGWAMIGLGVLAGAFALARMRTDGRRGILVQATLGLAMNLAFAGGIVYFRFVKPSPTGPGAPLVAAGDWRTYAPDGWGISVLLPGTPAEQTRQADSGVVQHAANIKQWDGTWFGVDWIDVPGLNAATADDFLTAATEDFKKSATLKDARPMTNAGYPGRDSTWALPTGATIRRRMFVVGSRAYTVMAGVAESEAAGRAGDLERFFESVKITGAGK